MAFIYYLGRNIGEQKNMHIYINKAFSTINNSHWMLKVALVFENA